MRILLIALTALLGWSALPSSASAEAAGAAPSKIGFLDPAKPACFARSYSAEHLTAHPRQKVADIAFVYRPTIILDGAEQANWSEDGSVRSLNAFVAVRLRGEESPVRLAVGGCVPAKGQTVECGVDEDGGIFALGTAKNGYLLKILSDVFVAPTTGHYEADAKLGVSIRKADDQEAFLLKPARGGLCETQLVPPDPSEWN